jgi:hypothetical protein
MRNLFSNLINASDPETCGDQAGYDRAMEDGLFERAMTLRDIFVPIATDMTKRWYFRTFMNSPPTSPSRTADYGNTATSFPDTFAGKRENGPSCLPFCDTAKTLVTWSFI